MATETWLHPTLIELLFEHRNKAYGAYRLRLSFNRNMARAVLAGIGLFLLMMGLLYKMSHLQNGIPNTKEALPDTWTVILNDLPRLIPVPPVEPPKPQPLIQSTPVQPIPPRVVSEQTIIEEVPAPHEPVSNAGVTGSTEDGGGQNEIGNEGLGISDGDSDLSLSEPVKESPFPLYGVHEKPEFPGGEAAMYEYLRKNSKFPQLARENGISGTVTLQFVINKKGEIENVKVLKSPSAIFNKPSIDLIEGMPKWSPGKVHGKPVSVIFVLPLKYQLL
jgi:protein TonB